MEQNYISHHGVKGMRWGVRKKQYVPVGRSSGSKKTKKLTPEEQAAQRRAQLLKSSNAKELYENRHLLSTAEINERLNRIDTEKKLGAVAAQSKKGLKYYANKATELSDSLNKFYQITETPLGKVIKNKLFGTQEDEVDLKDVNAVLKNQGKLSTQQLGEALKRANTLKSLKKLNGEEDDAPAKKNDGEKTADSKRDTKSDDKTQNTPKSTEASTPKTAETSKPKYTATNDKKYTGTKSNKKDSEPEVVTGELIGKEKSSSKSSSSTKSGSRESTTFWDVPYEDISTSSYTDRGRSVVSGLLGSSSSSNTSTSSLGSTSISGLLGSSSSSNRSTSSIGSTPIAGLLGSGSSGSTNSTVELGRSAVAGLLEPPKDR